MYMEGKIYKGRRREIRCTVTKRCITTYKLVAVLSCSLGAAYYLISPLIHTHVHMNYQVPLLLVNDSMPGLQKSFTSVYSIKRTLFNICIMFSSLTILYLRQHLTSTSPSLLHFDTLRQQILLHWKS